MFEVWETQGLLVQEYGVNGQSYASDELLWLLVPKPGRGVGGGGGRGW